MTEITQLTPQRWTTWEIQWPVGVFLTGHGRSCEALANHAQKSDSLSTIGTIANMAQQRIYVESHKNDRAQ